MLDGRRVHLRALESGDVARLREILVEPSVARWWPPDAFDDSNDPDDATVEFAICVEGELAGLIQYLEENTPRFRHAGIDLFLSGEHQGRGLGREAIAVLARHLISQRGHHRLVIDPAVANEAAIRCYQSVGFRAIGVMRRYELDHVSGKWTDSLLMDLLAEELVESSETRS